MENNSLKILLVEDNPDHVELFEINLSMTAYADSKVFKCESLKEALEFLNRETFDISFLDLSLQDSDIKNTLGAMRHFTSFCPVIVTTSLGDRATILEVINHGADDCLPKAEMQDKLLERTIRFALDRRALKNQLAESESLLKNIIDNTPSIIYLKQVDGRYKLVNKQFEKNFDKKGEEILGKNDREIFPREIATNIIENDSRVIETEQPILLEEAVPHGENLHTYVSSKFPLRDDTGSIYAIAGISTDITERKKAEEELQNYRERFEELIKNRTKEIELAHKALVESQKFLSNMISNLNGMVYHCKNDMDWTMDFMSSGCIAITGYKPEEIERNNKISYNEIIHPEDRERVWNEVQDALEKKEPFILSYKINTIDGKTKHVWEQGRGVWLDNGELAGLQGYVTDVTAEVASRNALAEAEKQMAHSDKLSTLGKLVGSVAHEFNNPLYGVLNIIDQFEEVMPDSEREILSKLAKKECWRMVEMIKNLQDFYKPSSGVISDINIKPLIDEVLLIIGKDIKRKGIKVTKNYFEGLSSFEGVQDQIKQVIINLIQNATDSITGPKGEIILTTEECDSEICIKVEDTGEGIHSDNIKLLFDPFFSTKDIKGTGLGLSVSYGIVKKHGGEIKVDSKVGKGSIFKVILPIKSRLKN